MKTQVMMNLIDQAAQDEIFKQNKELSQSLLRAYQDLDNDKAVKSVVRRLDGDISMYLMTHEYQAPQGIINLAQVMQKDNNSFWKGTGLSILFR